MPDTLLPAATPALRRPRLIGPARPDGDGVTVTVDGRDVEIAIDGAAPADLLAMLALLDGRRDAGEIAAAVAPGLAGQVEDLLSALDAGGLIDDAAPPSTRTGLDVILEIEDLTNELLYRTLYRNVFWQACQAEEPELPPSVVYGLAIENWHFLHRESIFDGLALTVEMPGRVRQLMIDFFNEEHRHDDLVLQALEAIGLDRAALKRSMPLPQTTAMINALAWWARSDPLFFLTTLNVLEGKDLEHDSYIAACRRMGVDDRFLAPIESHSSINLGHGHGALARQVFAEIPHVAPADVARLRAQTHLFIELYDRFYTGVWDHYATAPNLLRDVDAI